MNNNYRVNNIFNDDGLTFNELINTFLVSFLDKEFDAYWNNNTIDVNTILNL